MTAFTEPAQARRWRLTRAVISRHDVAPVWPWRVVNIAAGALAVFLLLVITWSLWWCIPAAVAYGVGAAAERIDRRSRSFPLWLRSSFTPHPDESPSWSRYLAKHNLETEAEAFQNAVCEPNDICVWHVPAQRIWAARCRHGTLSQGRTHDRAIDAGAEACAMVARYCRGRGIDRASAVYLASPRHEVGP